MIDSTYGKNEQRSIRLATDVMPNAKPYQKKEKKRARKEIAPDRRTKKNQNDRGRNSRRRRGNWNEHRAQRYTYKSLGATALGRSTEEAGALPTRGNGNHPESEEKRIWRVPARAGDCWRWPGGMGESRKERRARRGFNGGLAAFGRKSRGGGLVRWKWKMRRSGAGRRNV